ncbi:transposase [Candidatus Omnitrophota bacterium]
MTNLPKRRRNRLSDYDYSKEGLYFVTICSKDRKDIFAKYNKNTVGEGLAPSRNLPVRYKNHKIYNKGQPQGLSLKSPVQIKLTKIGQIIDRNWRDIKNRYNNIDIDEFIIMSNHIHGIVIINKWDGALSRADARPAPTISDIVCSFKSKSCVEYLKYIKQNDLKISGKIWQRSFYDHIIRNERSLQDIREYINNNPLNWDTDKNNINIGNKICP